MPTAVLSQGQPTVFDTEPAATFDTEPAATFDTEPAATFGATKPAKAAASVRFRPIATRRWLLIIALAIVAGYGLWSGLGTIGTAVQAIWSANPVWLTAGLAATALSMLAFGALRQRTLSAAGANLPMRDATRFSYEAGAVHLTAPAGTVFSTGYLFRRLQRRGFPPVAIAYSLAVSGLVSGIALAAVALSGFAVSGQWSSWASIVPVVGVAATVAVAVVAAVRHPAALAGLVERTVRGVNRILRRPAAAGLITLRATFADLRSVRPTRRDWWASGGAAVANWLLDLVCLWACAQAVGIHLAPWVLLTGYALAMAGAGASPLPGGLGVVDSILVLALTAAGAPAATALAAVLLYRLLSNGSVLAAGWTAIAARSSHRRMSVDTAH